MISTHLKVQKSHHLVLKIPIYLLVLCGLAYGLLIPTLGDYWNDWPYAYINNMFGPRGYQSFVD